MDLVLAKLAEKDHLIHACRVRQVCKAWRDAYEAYPAHVSLIMDSDPADVSMLASMLPSMASLSFLVAVEDLDLTPLRACTQLTSLSMAQFPYFMRQTATPPPPFPVHFDCLPPSLKTLSVVEVHAAMRLPLRTANLSSLTKLDWRSLTGNPAPVCAALYRLPELKVSLLSQMAL